MSVLKILLIGEYSSVHWSLTQALRALGHHVVLASSGDNFKNYYRDINIRRKSYSLFDTLSYTSGLIHYFSDFKGYDIVQIINPVFLELKVKRNYQAFKYLKKHNNKIFLGAFGDDYYWVKTCLEKKVFRYSEFDIPGKTEYLDLAQRLINNWYSEDRKNLNVKIAEESDGIIAGLCEYYYSYKQDYNEKLVYIPTPINTSEIDFRQRMEPEQVNFFIGIQKLRSQIKGTDVMYKVLREVNYKYEKECIITKSESLPYNEYTRMLSNGDILLDQLYSYSPGMNALMAMAKGLGVISGGEPETYDLLNESSNRPIINVLPDENDIYIKLENLILNKKDIPDISLKSRQFIEKHHNYIDVARQYLDFWTK